MIREIFFAAFACLFFSGHSAAQRDTIALNTGWHFTTDKTGNGFNEQWFNSSLPAARMVQLPHTWNVEEENQNHYGWGWYQKKINVPARWKNKNVVLQFGAINHTAYIYLNGKKIAENIGDGFSKFFINLNGLLEYGKENILTVACNNDYGRNKVPFGNSFDWPNDGGIIRKAALIVSGKPAAAYIHAEPVLNTKDSSASLKLKIGFDGPTTKELSPLHVRLKEANQPGKEVIFSQWVEYKWEKNEAVLEIFLPKVNPWHFDFPALYTVEVTRTVKNLPLITTTIGFRELKFVNGQTFLNGEHVKLMGVEWTAGSNPDFGFAETDAEILRHCKLMKDVNAIFTRQHFQQDDIFYDFCNRNGIIVQQELPLWGPETPVNDTIRSIAMKQLERMVGNYYNHPSVFSWGVGNELRGRDGDMKKFISDLLNRSRELDPHRMTAYVSNTLTGGFINNPSFVPDAASGSDYLMMNEYGGSWWDLPVGQIHLYLDSIHMSYPEKPFFISEFGLCEPNFKGGDTRRIEDLIYHMAVYESKPYVEGAIYFDLTDYRTHYPGTAENNKFRRRIHGIYDMYGNPKPSMKVLRELSSPVEVQGTRVWKKGKLNVLIFGSIGLPQHPVRGYKLYLSDREDNYLQGKAYALPEIKPGQRINFETDDLFDGKGIITIVRPTGFVVTQKSFY